MSQSNTKNIILNTIVGDALCSPFDGLGKAHISAKFKNIDDYTDVSERLKGHEDRWRMPGLYSSVSQFLVLSLLSHGTRGFNARLFCDAVARSPEIMDTEFGIFRNPGPVERNFIQRIKRTALDIPVSHQPCTRIIPACLPAAFLGQGEKDLFSAVLPLVSLFTTEVFTASAAVFFTALIRSFMKNPPFSGQDLVERAIAVNDSILSLLGSSPHIVFDLKMNPDSFTASQKKYHEILLGLRLEENKEAIEKKITSAVNQVLKTPITRATVNHPLAVVPYSLYLTAAAWENPGRLPFLCASEGGSASSLAALCGAVSATLYDESRTPDKLEKKLVNKKRILSLIDFPRSGAMSGQTDDFIKSEELLTIKEIEELNAKLKHIKPKKKKPRTQAEKEKDLSRHIVESWTKMDKAKWRRDKNQPQKG